MYHKKAVPITERMPGHPFSLSNKGIAIGPQNSGLSTPLSAGKAKINTPNADKSP
jgi:hypothetical protein